MDDARRDAEFARLGVTDHGGPRCPGSEEPGAPILLLHGLMGRGRAWTPHVGWLRHYGRVYTLDAAWHRGRFWRDPDFGPGLPGPGDPSIRTERFVADAAAALEAAGGGPATVVGHSMGGLHAWCLAAARPDLVRAIVVEDMSADFTGLSTRPWDGWFDSWPAVFTRARASEMFGDVAGAYFLDCFDRADDGWRVHGDMAVWRAIAEHWTTRDYRHEWAGVQCPALLIEAGWSATPAGQMRAMARVPRRGVTRYVRVPGAGHLVQSDAPHEYRGAVEAFLAEL